MMKSTFFAKCGKTRFRLNKKKKEKTDDINNG